MAKGITGNVGKVDVTELTKRLGKLYPTEYWYGSKSSLYQVAVRDGVASEEDYNAAQTYYGRLWYYVGD